MLDRFTTLGANGIETGWWWEHLKGPTTSRTVGDALAVLDGTLPPDASVWLLVEDYPADGSQKRIGRHWVLEADVRSALRVLTDVHYVEYYLVDRKCEWLVCENHHGVLVAAGVLAVNWIDTSQESVPEARQPLGATRTS